MARNDLKIPLKNNRLMMKYLVNRSDVIVKKAHAVEAWYIASNGAEFADHLFLSYLAEFFYLEGKRRRMQKEGLKAWVDPDEYKRRLAAKKQRLKNC